MKDAYEQPGIELRLTTNYKASSGKFIVAFLKVKR